MTELFLSRSQGYPLEVCLYLGDFVTSRPIKDALKLIAPSTPRWTRFCIHARTSEDVFPIQGHIRTLQDMVRLCAFELRVTHISSPNILGFTAHLLGMPLPPKLETIVCVGMSMGYQSPALRGLTRLTLENLNAPSPAKFRELCIQNPQLDYMRLVNTSPPLYMDQDGQFVLNSLRTLEFVLESNEYDEEYRDESYVVSFFNALSVPALQELSFRTNLSSAWEGFERAIVAGQDMLFQDLRVLRLAILQPVTFYRSISSTLFSNFPQLKELSFHAFDDGPAQHLLQEWIFTMTDVMPPEIWPQLKTLAVRTPDYANNEMKDLLDLLESLRRSKGQPIEAWWESISTTTRISLQPDYGGNNYMCKHVEVLKTGQGVGKD